MNPLYDMLVGRQGMPGQMQQQVQQAPASFGPRFQNPMQKMSYIMQAMQNPAAFVKQQIPDLPDEIANDPNKILRYLQQTRGVSDAQIQQAASQIPGNVRRY